MGILAWTMMGLAIWHFTIFLPDRFWSGIVGAFLGSLIGANVTGFLISGLSVPGQHGTHLLTALDAVPGALIGIGAMYLLGVAQERRPTTA